MTASERLATFLDHLSHVSVDDLAMVGLAEPDAVARADLLAAARSAVDAGSDDDRAAFAAARAQARDAVVRSFSARSLDPTWFGLNWGRSIGRADDRARLILAAEDAAVAAVVEGLLPSDDVEALREPFVIATSLTGAAPTASPTFERRVRGPVVAGFVIASIVSTLIAGFGGIILLVLGRRGSRADPDDSD